MAIAFYIPDQNKLLASYNGSNNNNNGSGSGTSSSNNSSTTQNQQASHQQPQVEQQQQATRQQQQQQQTDSPTNHTSGTQPPATPNFRANITIPLATYGNGRSTGSEANAVGCWELFAQVFCYALGCYRATMLSPAAIQISFEISSSSSVAGFLTAEPTTTTTTTTTTATSDATVTATSTASPSPTSPTSLSPSTASRNS